MNIHELSRIASALGFFKDNNKLGPKLVPYGPWKPPVFDAMVVHPLLCPDTKGEPHGY